MAEQFVWYVCVFGTAALFYCIGIYAQRRKKPMWFWAGAEVREAEITDVRAYNRENGRMWKIFSVWFWLAGAAMLWSAWAALLLLFLGCTAGIAILIGTFRRIDKKYRANERGQTHDIL